MSNNNNNACCACNNGTCQKCACARNGVPCTNCNSPGCCNGGAAPSGSGQQNNSNLNNPRGGVAAQKDGCSFQDQIFSFLCIAIMTVIGVALLGPVFGVIGGAFLIAWIFSLAVGFGDNKP